MSDAVRKAVTEHLAKLPHPFKPYGHEPNQCIYHDRGLTVHFRYFPCVMKLREQAVFDNQFYSRSNSNQAYFSLVYEDIELHITNELLADAESTALALRILFEELDRAREEAERETRCRLIIVLATKEETKPV